METQASISLWAIETFGDAGGNFRVAARANEEVAELVRAVSPGGDRAKILDECADVWICHCRLAERVGYDLATLDSAILIEGISLMGAAARAQIHSGKVLYLIATNEHSPYAKCAVAHLVKFLRYIVASLDGHLSDEVNRKMAINRNRQWERDGSGHGYHVSHQPADRPVQTNTPHRVLIDTPQTREKLVDDLNPQSRHPEIKLRARDNADPYERPQTRETMLLRLSERSVG